MRSLREEEIRKSNGFIVLLEKLMTNEEILIKDLIFVL
jgi:hypothetical protein